MSLPLVVVRVQGLVHMASERFVKMSDKKDSGTSTEQENAEGAVGSTKVVQRGDDILYEPRDGGDRRGGGRGLNPGRRLVDHHRVRSAFIERVDGLIKKGHSEKTIAAILNDEEFETAGGELWTEDAIVQLQEVLKERRTRDAWLPNSLGVNGDDD
jgi:hypothetical protein